MSASQLRDSRGHARQELRLGRTAVALHETLREIPSGRFEIRWSTHILFVDVSLRTAPTLEERHALGFRRYALHKGKYQYDYEAYAAKQSAAPCSVFPWKKCCVCRCRVCSTECFFFSGYKHKRRDARKTCPESQKLSERNLLGLGKNDERQRR